MLANTLLPLWEKVPEGRMRGEPHPFAAYSAATLVRLGRTQLGRTQWQV
jgi:hypothetical protein